MASIRLEKLSVPLSALREGVSAFAFRVCWPDLSLGEGRCFPHEVDVTAAVTRMGDDYLVDLEVFSEGEFLCDRCGEEFRKNIRGRIETLFTFDAVKAGGDRDVQILPATAQEIDISQDVRDALLLAVPVKCLCCEGCLGVCPRCGTNLNKNRCSCSGENLDPRWEDLRGLELEE